MSVHYLGQTPTDLLGYGVGENRFFYALRRTDEGELYFTRVDQFTGDDVITVNVPSDEPNEDWPFFEPGIDYYDNVNPTTKEKNYKNLRFDQYRWDSRSIRYYINENGELVARINEPYDYPEDI